MVEAKRGGSVFVGVVAILAGFVGLTLAGFAGFSGAMPGLGAGAGLIALLVMSVIAIGGGIWELSHKPDDAARGDT